SPLIVNAIAGDNTQPTLHLAFLSAANIEILPTGSARSGEVGTALSAAGLNKLTERISGTVMPNSDLALSFFITHVDMTTALRTVIPPGELVSTVARVTVVATIDGRSVSSLPFEYPLSFCLGCLVEDVGDCANLADSFVASPGGACNPLQDVVLQCCNN